MAPEQVEGASELDGRVDLYALGTMLYELLSAKQAWGGDSIVAVAAESVYLASSGCSVRYFVAASIEERIRSLVMPRLLTLIAPVAEPIAVWKPRSLGVVSLRGRFVDHVSGNV